MVPNGRPPVAIFPIDAAAFGSLLSLTGKFGGARTDTFNHNLRETNPIPGVSELIPDDVYFRGDLPRYKDAVEAFFDWSATCNSVARQRALGG